MMRALLVLMVLAGLSACGRDRIPTRPQPVPAQCDAQCYAPCATTLPAWEPTNADSAHAWEELPEQVIAPAKAQLDQCEARRGACVQCLDRLKRAGVLQ